MTQAEQQRFLLARRELIRRQFLQLNDMQQQAVLTTKGPLLLLAGAGSGKTTVLIHRIANLIRFGSASDSPRIPSWITEADLEDLERALEQNAPMTPRLETLCALDPVAPWSIIAITFTNKAAGELKARLGAMLGEQAEQIWAMTFHSACCRILRRYIDRLGYDSRFTIYDTADAERVMKDVMKEQLVDERELPLRLILNQISRAKDRMQFPKDFQAANAASTDPRIHRVGSCYAEYQRRLQAANALDFDDIILLTVKLLQDDAEVRAYYQTKFRYVLIDEYQDTNHLQYLLSTLLAGGSGNICVVGDDDQSIYKFRGATIENILNFEQQYQGARLIRLEQNYRSTQTILDAANAVISHNRMRKGKTLWTKNSHGDKILLKDAVNENEEANFVASRIFSMSPPAKYKDFAVLYRTNAQSNALERSFKFNGIPYRIIGGTRFFDRAEVKDMLAYLCLINNRADDLRLRRILNNPPRGIGPKTLDTVERLAAGAGLPLYLVLSDPYQYAALEKSAAKLLAFSAMIEESAKLLDTLPLPEFYDALLERTGYVSMLRQERDAGDEKAQTRLDNVRELRSSLVGYVENHPEDASLNGFLEEIALYTDIEQYDPDADAVVMMTMHAAKGLEFPHVFLVGMEDGLFPSQRSIGEDGEMEEERRLCYVAITRAKQSLAISFAEQRMLYGHTTTGKVSRFVEDIPEALLSAPPRKKPAFVPYDPFEDLYGTGASARGSYDRPQPGRRTSTGVPVDPSGRSLPRPYSSNPTGSRPGSSDPSRPGPDSSRPNPPKGAHPNPFRSAAASGANAPIPDYRPGDMVQHTAFGRGMVVSVIRMGNDALLEIAFDEKGTKKLMARTASAHMKKV